MSKHPTPSRPSRGGPAHPAGPISDASDQVMDAQSALIDLNRCVAWLTNLAEQAQVSLRNAQQLLQPRLAASA